MSADVGDVRGLWRRTIYRRGNEAPDTSTDVHWMQGPRFFADIRQPVEGASFVRVGCLRDLEPEHLAWLALQEAFAGELELEGNLAWWRRAIDLKPQGPFEDRARLQQTGDVIDEYGTESPYYERWERQNPTQGHCWGIRLQSLAEGRGGFLVRAGDKLMFARARTAPLPPGRILAEILDEIPTLEGKQDLLDFEVSLGCMPAGGHQWLIERSTLPFKQGKLWSITRRAASSANREAPGTGAGLIEVDDLDSHGERIVSAWRIVDTDANDAARELEWE
jgi:hypothetical protein